MVQLMIEELQTQAQPAQPFEQGTRYVIRVRKQEGLTRLSAEYYPRYIFRNLQRTPLEETSIVVISTRRHLLLFTSHLHPEDAEDFRSAFAVFPDVEMYPIVEDVEQGKPYWRHTFCVKTFPNRKTIRLPKVASLLNNYRWVVFEKVGGELEGILISEEPPVVPYPCDLSTEAYLITASDVEDTVYYADLTGYRTCFSFPLSHTCLTSL